MAIKANDNTDPLKKKLSPIELSKEITFSPEFFKRCSFIFAPNNTYIHIYNKGAHPLRRERELEREIFCVTLF